MALTSYQDFVAGGATDAQRILNHAWWVKGQGERNFYALEVDPSTGALPVTLSSSSPRVKAWNASNNYASVNVTTAAYVELVASTGAAASRLLVFDGSGQVMKIAFGAAASEVDQFYISPGGWDAAVEISVPINTRVSVRAISATASAGYLVIAAFS